MEIGTVFGLPLHPLVVHAVVVLVPLAALGGVLTAVSARLRRRYGWLTVGAAGTSMLLIPVASGSGEALEERVRQSPLLEAHTHMAEGLLPFVVVLFVASAALMSMVTLRDRRLAAGPGTSANTPGWTRPVTVAALVVTLLAAAGATVQVARIGHSGARATWTHVNGGSSAG